MQLSYFKYVLIFLVFNKIISFEKNYDNCIFGKFILSLNDSFYNSYNISIHPILNYSYLLKFNYSIEKINSNITFTKVNNMHINLKVNNNYFNIYILDNEDSIINLILKKSIDSMLSFNYLIFTSNDISKTIGESLSYQIFYINNNDYFSIINFIQKYYRDNNSNISINLFYDNICSLIPSKFINYSKKIPLYTIILLIAINKIFFNKNRYYNLCFNSSILRIIFSMAFILITNEKIKYNKNKFKYISGLSIDSYIDSINNLIDDIFLSFLLTSILFIINNEINIIKFFSISDTKVKIYFCVFLFLSLINIPDYLFNQTNEISFIDIIFLKIKKIIYELLEIFLFIYFINKQINIISKAIFFYSVYHIENNLKFLIIKKLFFKNVRFAFLILIFFNIFLHEITFRKYKNNLYYWDIVSKCLTENINSSIIFVFWFLLNISEENNPLLLLLSKKRNTEIKISNIYKFELKNEITRNNYYENKPDLNISIYKKYPLIILNPFIDKINNSNIENISIGIIE